MDNLNLGQTLLLMITFIAHQSVHLNDLKAIGVVGIVGVVIGVDGVYHKYSRID